MSARKWTTFGVFATALAIGALLLAGCGGGGSTGGGGGNAAPVINSLSADSQQIWPNATADLTASATDADGDTLTYQWNASGGIVTGSGASATFTAPATGGQFTVTVTVIDGNGGQDSEQITITVGASVEGRVVDVQASNAPAQNVTVNIGGLTDVTDASGEFRVTGLDQGTYDLLLSGTWAVAGQGVQVTLTTPGQTVDVGDVPAFDVGSGPPPPPF